MKDIFCAIPAYTGDICVQTMHCLLQSMEEAAMQGWMMHPKNLATRISDADIAMARNTFLGLFLKSACTDLVFVDADISWYQGQFTRLLAHPVDLVAATYRAKTDKEEKYTVLWPKEKKIQEIEGGFPLLEAAGVGMGFCRITRKGLENLMSKITYERFYDPIFELECPWIFDKQWVKDKDTRARLSEDYFFCHKWREAGGQVWIDPMLTVDHIGKKMFCGNLIEHLRAETYKAI